MKKKLRPIEYYASIFWGLFTAELADRFTDKYNMYYFFNPYFVEAKSLLVILGIYPAATMLMINWYPFNCPLKNKFYYIICWSIFSILYEWLCLKMGLLHHKNWNMWLSAISYPFLYALLIGNLKLIRLLDNKKKA
ncbi:CBO0543 family protein [Bacillaceae bacterium C204]|uniref:CBO0543 family protein n=1 Tax=Neobacillus sp. 204 TaxID=3383351 RepID=UPI003979BE03